MLIALMSYINYLVIPVILVIGLIITIGDFKEGKIKNKWIKLGIYLGLAYYAILIIFSVLDRANIIQVFNLPLTYYLYVLGNTLTAFILGFALWHLKLWAGGDAKLFTLYAFLIPLSFYSNAYFKYFPSLNLLINIILPIFIYLLIKMLLYPFQLAINYLKSPQLLKEYWQKYKEKNKIDKTKIKEYLNVGVSFIVIMIIFQVLRTRIGEFMNPYLGKMVTAGYFLMGFTIFKPLQALLKKRTVLAAILVLIYFVTGFIFFREMVFSDLHKVFALQMIFMLSYFYIFKYGKALGLFLYNSSEVRMIPLAELQPGVYINKEYIKQIMGSRTNLNEFNKGIETVLDKDEKEELSNLIKRKTDKDQKERQQYQLISLLRNLRLDALPGIIKQIYQYKKQKDVEKILLEKVNAKLNEKQKQELDNLLNNTDEVKKFLKIIRGKLTEEQALILKEMIEKRNEEVTTQGLDPIDKIILHKTFSFAPFMLLGVLITLITKSSIIHLIFQLFGR